MCLVNNCYACTITSGDSRVITASMTRVVLVVVSNKRMNFIENVECFLIC